MYDDNDTLEPERIKWLKVNILKAEKENIKTQARNDTKMIEKLTEIVKTGVNGKIVR